MDLFANVGYRIIIDPYALMVILEFEVVLSSKIILLIFQTSLHQKIFLELIGHYYLRYLSADP